MKYKNMSILGNFSKTVVKVESFERNAKLRKESNYYEFCDPAFFCYFVNKLLRSFLYKAHIVSIQQILECENRDGRAVLIVQLQVILFHKKTYCKIFSKGIFFKILKENLLKRKSSQREIFSKGNFLEIKSC